MTRAHYHDSGRGPSAIWRAGALAVIAGLSACHTGSEPTGTGTVSLQVQYAESVTRAVDEFRATIDGPVQRMITAAPGTTDTIAGLPEGTYSVIAEGLVGNLVDVFDEVTSVQVRDGQNTRVALVVSPFAPTLNPPASPSASTTVSVSYSTVEGAQSYTVEWDTDAGFADPQGQSEPGTSTSVTFPNVGTFFVRVQAVSVLGSAGTYSNVESVEVIDAGTELEAIMAVILDPFLQSLLPVVDPGVEADLRSAFDDVIAAAESGDITAVHDGLAAATTAIEGSNVPGDAPVLATIGLFVDYSLGLLP